VVMSKMVHVKLKLCDARKFVEVVKEGAMARDSGKFLTEAVRDRQGGHDDDGCFHLRQEGDTASRFKGGGNTQFNSG
jgi:hypothetical protein